MLKIKNRYANNDIVSQIVSWGHWFVLFNIFVIIGLGSRYLIIADWPPSLLGRIYAIISCIGHFSFLAFITYLIFIFPLSFFIRSPRWQCLISTLIATIGITFILIDTEIFYRVRMHLNWPILQIFTRSDSDTLSGEWQKLFIFVPLIFLLETLFALWSWKKLRSLSKRRRYARPLVIIFILCFLSSHLIHIWADANFYRPITMQRSSLPLSYPLTARHLLERYGLIDPGNYETRLEQVGNPFAIAVEYPLAPVRYEKTATPYNLLMIVVDGLYKNTPYLNKLAEGNISFTQHFSSSTHPSLGKFSLFYGLDPNYFNSILVSHTSSALLDTLSKQQYNFGLFSANGFAEPFYRFALLSNFSLPEIHKQSNEKTTEYWQAWYQEQQQNDQSAPWFSLLEYSLTNEDGAASPANGKKLDTELTEVIDQLRASGQLDRTVVVITGSTGKVGNDHQILDRDYLKTPLIMLWPNKSAQRINEVSTHVDIMSTLMADLLHVTTAPTKYSLGNNLFSGEDRKWIIAGNTNEIAALYADKTITIDAMGRYQIYNEQGVRSKNPHLDLSTFLQLLTTNRRFMVTE